MASIKLGISVDQLAKYRKKGLIEATKHKNTYRYTHMQISKFIQERENI